MYESLVTLHALMCSFANSFPTLTSCFQQISHTSISQVQYRWKNTGICGGQKSGVLDPLDLRVNQALDYKALKLKLNIYGLLCETRVEL